MTHPILKSLCRFGFSVACGLAIFLAIPAESVAAYGSDLAYYAACHLELVGAAMLLALAAGIPIGILLSRPCMARHAAQCMQLLNVGNTIPSLAVLALALAAFGIGRAPAILALWLAALLPVVRNTLDGVRQVPPASIEAARGIGMSRMQTLRQVELPNALPVIFGGVRTALAIVTGTAPLAFLIGADSLGTLIFPAIYLDRQEPLLLGAAATAALALLLDSLVATAGRVVMQRHGIAPV
jgi:osmoprotectant transport system permease protein